MKKNKGITLVALIITIVVMLILVAVTISILINANIIGSTEKAGKKYEEEMKNEMHAYEDVVKEYEDKTRATITFTIEGDSTKYTAIEGMTLSDWIASKYNTTGYAFFSQYEIGIPVTGEIKCFYGTDIITDGCTIKEHLIKFTIDGLDFTCPEYFKSWEEWAGSKYNTTGASVNDTLENITIDRTRHGATIDGKAKPEEGHEYGWAGPTL